MPEDKDAYNAAIAMVLKLRRSELSMTLAEVAAASDITAQSVQRFLAGERAIHLGNFIALAHALQIDPAAVMEQAYERIEKSRSKLTS